MQELVFIGNAMGEHRTREIFSECLLTQTEFAEGPELWDRYDDPLPADRSQRSYQRIGDIRMSDQPNLVSIGVDQPIASSSATTAWRDWIGIVASIGCAIHCAAMPFAIAFLPAFGLSFLADESFHQWMALLCFIIALAAFVPGWRKHRRLTPAIIAFAGITVITSAAFGMTGDCCAECSDTENSSAVVCTEACCEFCVVDASEEPISVAPTASNANLLNVPAWLIPWVTPIGGLLLVCGHLLNRRYGCLCGCCNVEEASAT